MFCNSMMSVRNNGNWQSLSEFPKSCLCRPILPICPHISAERSPAGNSFNGSAKISVAKCPMVLRSFSGKHCEKLPSPIVPCWHLFDSSIGITKLLCFPILFENMCRFTDAVRGQNTLISFSSQTSNTYENHNWEHFALLLSNSASKLASAFLPMIGHCMCGLLVEREWLLFR